MTFPANPLRAPETGAAPRPRLDGPFFESGARPFLGTILVRKGWVTQERLDAALAECTATKRRLGEILLERGWLFENELAHALAEQSGLQYVDLVSQGVDPVAAALLPADFARHYFVVPVRFLPGERLLVAAAEPDDADVAVLETILQRGIVVAVAERTAIRGAWRHVFP
jgi:type IV pilus assembly protein PilB